MRYFCKACKKYFSVNARYLDTKGMLSDHLDGLSFRDLARKYNISPMTAWRICETELKKLPNNNKFTHKFCDRFGSTLVVDAKFFRIKGYRYGYGLLWGIDYFKHDIPIHVIAPSESYHSWSKYFSYYRITNNYPELLVCDDNVNIKMAAKDKFPEVKIQTCLNHYKENIRKSLRIRSDDTYKPFMKRIDEVFNKKRTDIDMYKHLRGLWREYEGDPVCEPVLLNIQRYHTELTGYRNIPRSPVTSNMIEGLNSHLQGRLKALQSFESVKYAKLWMNGYILKRRYTRWTDCKGKFKKLNGKRGVDQTKKHGIVLPTYFE